MSKRIEQFNKLIKQEISKLLVKEIEFPKGCLVTVTKVKTLADLKYAQIFVSVLPPECKRQVLKVLKKNISHLQFLLGKRVVARFVPKISFSLDVTEEEAEEVEKLLREIYE